MTRTKTTDNVIKIACPYCWGHGRECEGSSSYPANGCKGTGYIWATRWEDR